jgi:hypothetical protein
MLEFNWGIFWALLGAFAVRGIYRDTRQFIREIRKRANELKG